MVEGQRRSPTNAKEEARLQRHFSAIERGDNPCDDIDEAIEMDKQRWGQRIRRIIALAVLGLVVAAIVDLALHDNVKAWLQASFNWIEANPYSGIVVFALIFSLATLLFVPGVILTIGAGVAFGRALGFGFGLLFGSVAVLAGAVAACVVAFYLGRYVLHEQAQKCAKRYRILGAVNTAIEKNGVKVMILLRLSPLVPFSGFNFIAGLTKVSLRSYLFGCLGIVPGTLAFVYIGASTAGTMNERHNMRTAEGSERTACLIRIITLVVGGVAAVLAIVAVTVYARKALSQALKDSELENSSETKVETKEGDELVEHECDGASTDMESRSGSIGRSSSIGTDFEECKEERHAEAAITASGSKSRSPGRH